MRIPSFSEIRTFAFEIGWDDVGIAPAIIPEGDSEAYRAWIRDGGQASMAYMEKEMRTDPQQLFPGAKCALIFVTNYKQPKVPFQKGMGVVASYARGRDYHRFHHKRLKKTVLWLENYVGQKNIAKAFSDSSPILEKALAVQAGLGWFGKNTLFIHPRFGTYTLLSGILTILDLSLSQVGQRENKCGKCGRCLAACPTGALTAPYHLDAKRCLAYHLIESKERIPQEIAKKNPGYLFGCDMCQEACPHNLKTPYSSLAELSPENGVGSQLSMQDLETIEKCPQKLFGTPLQRKGIGGLKENLRQLLETGLTHYKSSEES